MNCFLFEFQFKKKTSLLEVFIYFIMTETKVCLVRMNYAPFSWVSQQKLWLVEAV